MYKVRIYSVGKTKEAWLEQAISEYKRRLQNALEIEFIWTKSDAQLLDHTSKESFLICLDPHGIVMDSLDFSRCIFRKFEEAGARMAIVIGGADGLPSSLKARSLLISLSSLTFTHQLARLILMEQLYRAFEINKGSAYHK